VAVAEVGGEVRSLGTIPNDADAIRRLIRKLEGPEGLHVCYEAGPCGYVLYWQLAKMGVRCDVVAPTLIPVKAGDRVKTDRRDAEKLARSLRAGDLTPVWVPDAEHEALRDLVRAREAAKADQRRARQRLLKFLLRRGCAPPPAMGSWTDKHREWILKLKFEQRALEETLTDLRRGGGPPARARGPFGTWHRRGRQQGSRVDARRHRRASVAARRVEVDRNHPRRRSGRAVAVRARRAIDGLQRRGAQRAFERR